MERAPSEPVSPARQASSFSRTVLAGRAEPYSNPNVNVAPVHHALPPALSALGVAPVAMTVEGHSESCACMSIRTAAGNHGAAFRNASPVPNDMMCRSTSMNAVAACTRGAGDLSNAYPARSARAKRGATTIAYSTPTRGTTRSPKLGGASGTAAELPGRLTGKPAGTFASNAVVDELDRARVARPLLPGQIHIGAHTGRGCEAGSHHDLSRQKRGDRRRFERVANGDLKEARCIDVPFEDARDALLDPGFASVDERDREPAPAVPAWRRARGIVPT